MTNKTTIAYLTNALPPTLPIPPEEDIIPLAPTLPPFNGRLPYGLDYEYHYYEREEKYYRLGQKCTKDFPIRSMLTFLRLQNTGIYDYDKAARAQAILWMNENQEKFHIYWWGPFHKPGEEYGIIQVRYREYLAVSWPEDVDFYQKLAGPPFHWYTPFLILIDFLVTTAKQLIALLLEKPAPVQYSELYTKEQKAFANRKLQEIDNLQKEERSPWLDNLLDRLKNKYIEYISEISWINDLLKKNSKKALSTSEQQSSHDFSGDHSSYFSNLP